MAAWVNNDYGDGSISRQFNGTIPQDQQRVTGETRTMIRRRIGDFEDYELAASNPSKYSQKIVERSRNLAALAIQLQWVEGDATKAETSYFKINQEAAPINKTELVLLRARKKPNALAARAIIRSGTGHKYWSKFAASKQPSLFIRNSSEWNW